jgi:hypothetical protein
MSMSMVSLIAMSGRERMEDADLIPCPGASAGSAPTSPSAKRRGGEANDGQTVACANGCIAIS